MQPKISLLCSRKLARMLQLTHDAYLEYTQAVLPAKASLAGTSKALAFGAKLKAKRAAAAKAAAEAAAGGAADVGGGSGGLAMLALAGKAGKAANASPSHLSRTGIACGQSSFAPRRRSVSTPLEAATKSNKQRASVVLSLTNVRPRSPPAYVTFFMRSTADLPISSKTRTS